MVTYKDASTTTAKIDAINLRLITTKQGGTRLMKITVFTPTYNRAHTLLRLYRSLEKQTFSDFEWLKIDDGSTDNTEELITAFIKENKINIRYLKVKNGGKHRAINKATEIAYGEIFFIVDSDDYLLDNALSRLVYWFSTIEKSGDKFVGVCGLRGYSPIKMIGSSFDGVYKDAISSERSKYKIFGDKSEAVYTKILKQYKFPEFYGENFITEAVVWSKLGADGYKMRYFNEIIYITEYLAGGLTDRSSSLFRENINGTLYTYSLLMRHNYPLKTRIRYCLLYLSFFAYSKKYLYFLYCLIFWTYSKFVKRK